MSVYGNTLAVTVLICVVSGCGGKFDRDTAEGWKAWAESSSEGLWEGSEEHSVELLQVKEYCGENDDLGVYIPEGLAMSGDTLFVTDTANQSITCFTVDGTVLWNSGEAGEGPGNFTTIGNITSGDDVIAVCNKALGRVDILDRYNGEWVSSVQVFWPFDVAIEHDSLYVASVGTETLISVFSISSGELLYGFGNDFWEEGSLGELSVQGNANINISIEEGKLLVSSYFQNSGALFDAKTGSMLTRIAREMPVERSGARSHNNQVVFSVYYVDCCLYNGIVHMAHGGTGEEISTEEDYSIPDWCIVDRYNLRGEYLDSIALPHIVSSIDIDDTILVAVDSYSYGMIWVFDLVHP